MTGRTDFIVLFSYFTRNVICRENVYKMPLEQSEVENSDYEASELSVEQNQR